MDLWNSGQDAGRWSVFRLGPFSHSTLTINQQRHRVAGHAAFTHMSGSGDAGAVVDLSPIFQGQASCVTRGFVFRRSSHMLVRDEVEGLHSGDVVRWAMLTRADVAVSEGDAPGTEAILRQDGQTLRVRLHSSVKAKFETVSAEPPNEFDAPNPGARLLIVHLTAPASGRLNVAVTFEPILSPDAAPPPNEKLAGVEISRWPLSRVS